MEYIVYFLGIMINLPFALNGNIFNIGVICFIFGVVASSIIDDITRNKYR